ncbi:MAG: alpha/beta hydrolase fold domain-containing protein [Alphaproteobacteria bacterium]|nr:alpha/beta hydrolase fold domain-containing protein [Alphaproteobacteria bacterium]
MKPKPLHQIEPPVLRAWIEQRTLPLLPKGVAKEEAAGAVRGEWHRPHNAESGRAVLYLHGGGYVFGSPRTHRTVTFPLALAAGADVFSLDYRLAPEHPCPAAIEDAVAAYEFLLSQGREPGSIVFAGDSAGGGLAVTTLLALKERGAPMPAGAVLYSPFVDFTMTGESLDRNEESDAMFNKASIVEGSKHYRGGLDPKDWRLSPIFADLGGLPPMLVFASRSEMLFDDAVRLALKARESGVDMRFEERDGLVHVWPVFHPLLPEAKETIGESADFIRERTKG